MYIPIQLERLVLERSGGCCEYCRVHQNDDSIAYHFEPIIAVSHGGMTTEDNLAYSCSRCNLSKGTNIAAADPDTGKPTFLFHPREHVWHEHFRLEGPLIVPLTPEGRATVFVLRLNEPKRVQRRQILIQISTFPCKVSDVSEI